MYISRKSTITFEKNVFKETFLLSSKLLFFIALNVWITINDEKQIMKKTFICVSFYTSDEKLCKYQKTFGENSKNRNKMIQSGTPVQHSKNWDFPGKTGKVGIFVLVNK